MVSFAFPKVADFDCSVVLSMLIIQRTSFNNVTPIKKLQLFIWLRIPAKKKYI